MRTLLAILGCLAPIAMAGPQDEAAPAPSGPDAVLVDRDGHEMTVTDLGYAVEETEAGTVFVTRMPYLPLRTGRGEWRIPLGSVLAITVAEPPRPPTLAQPVSMQGGLAVRVAADGTPAAVEQAPALGDPALDAALAALVRRQRFVAGHGAPGVAGRPVRLRVDLRVTPLEPEPVTASPTVTLRLTDGTELSGEPMVAGTWVGKAGVGEYRLALADCRSIAIGKPR